MRFWIVSFLTMTLFISCSKEENVCNACQDSLDHMAGKIATNGCNPNNMQSAWDRIQDDCGNRTNDAVGYLAENCSFGYNGRLICTEIAYGLRISDDGKRPILLENINPVSNDTLEFHVSQAPDYTGSQIMVVPANQVSTLEYNAYADYGAAVYILVLHKTNRDTLATKVESFNYNRPNNWDKKRTVKMVYDANFQGFTTALENW